MGAEPAKWERYRALETNEVYRIVEVEHGADVARQFQAIAEGQPIGDQEPNGLQRIEETLAELEKARVIGGLNLRPSLTSKCYYSAMVSVEQRFQIPFFRGLPRHALQELAAPSFVRNTARRPFG